MAECRKIKMMNNAPTFKGTGYSQTLVNQTPVYDKRKRKKRKKKK
jgi:hypothetical protein